MYSHFNSGLLGKCKKKPRFSNCNTIKHTIDFVKKPRNFFLTFLQNIHAIVSKYCAMNWTLYCKIVVVFFIQQRDFFQIYHNHLQQGCLLPLCQKDFLMSPQDHLERTRGMDWTDSTHLLIYQRGL